MSDDANRYEAIEWVSISKERPKLPWTTTTFKGCHTTTLKLSKFVDRSRGRPERSLLIRSYL